MEFEAVPEFLSTYDRLTGRDLEVVNGVLDQLRVHHETSWARQGSIRGGETSAWIAPAGEWRVYWAYGDSQVIVLLALIGRL